MCLTSEIEPKGIKGAKVNLLRQGVHLQISGPSMVKRSPQCKIPSAAGAEKRTGAVVNELV